MSYFSLLSLSIYLVLLLHGCPATPHLPQIKCQLDRLIAAKPDTRIPSEAGFAEFWNPDSHHFRCAGVAVIRYTIQPSGLISPFYRNHPQVSYIAQGNGVFGLMIRGCSQEYSEKREEKEEKEECKKIHEIKNGDVVALRAGEAHWVYNSGNQILVIISVHHVTSTGRPKQFFLAGNPKGEGGSHKIFSGFSLEFVSNGLNIDKELARKLRSEMDPRGSITYMSGGGLHLCSSQTIQLHNQDQQEKKRHRGVLHNVVDESFCNTRIANISDSSSADLFVPKVGHFKTINSHHLPILESAQLSSSYEVLQKDVMRLPHWEMNSNAIIYVVKGEGTIEVVNENGKSVFNDVVEEGELLIVPQNFVLAKLAKSEIFEYVTFKTNANPITSDLSGRNSVIYDLPLDVLTNAFKITKQQATTMKFGRKETSLAKIVPKYI